MNKDDEHVESGLLLVVIVLLVLWCGVKAINDHPDWFDAEVKITNPNWHAFDVQPHNAAILAFGW